MTTDSLTIAAVHPDPLQAYLSTEAKPHWILWRYLQQAVAALLLLALIPPMALVYVLVKKDSQGPFLYAQQRPGRNGQLFTAFKIRTMTVGADRNPMLARAVTSDSPEVTRIGRVLRDLKLDELPQLWNVMRGEMTFVGPRPLAPSLQALLETHITGFDTRLLVSPGLTSLGQVCIEENETADRVVQDWSVRFEAERHYLNNRSIAYDLIIIGMTIAYCLRKVMRRLSLSGTKRRRELLLVLAGIATLMLAGCATNHVAEGLQPSAYGLSRTVPWSGTGHKTSIVDHARVSLETVSQGQGDLIYRLGSGDRIVVNVFGEPGMDALVVQVDSAGNIQLPIVENVSAAGLSLSELQQLLKEEYTKHFLEPWVVVQLQQALSRPLYLLGEFNQPGIVHMQSDLNVIQALGEGRGLSESAYTRGARLIRNDQVVAVDIHALLNNGRMDQNVWLQPNDTIFVPGVEDLRVFVLGAVIQPGSLEVTNASLTLADAIARSGGHRRGEADLEQVRVIRTHSPVSGELFVVDFNQIIRGEALDMPLEPGDIVYMPANNIGGWNEIIAAISPTILTISRALDPIVLAQALSDEE